MLRVFFNNVARKRSTFVQCTAWPSEMEGQGDDRPPSPPILAVIEAKTLFFKGYR